MSTNVERDADVLDQLRQFLRAASPNSAVAKMCRSAVDEIERLRTLAHQRLGYVWRIESHFLDGTPDGWGDDESRQDWEWYDRVHGPSSRASSSAS